MPLTPQDTQDETSTGENAPAQLVRSAGTYVKNRPWLALLVAAGLGVALARVLF